jgi:hypothetical protein
MSFVSYEEASKIVRKLGISRCSDYYHWKNRPSNLPQSPSMAYKNKGWNGWKKFLGKKWLTHDEAMAIVSKQGFRSHWEFYCWKDRPKNIPSNPNVIYYNTGWLGWRTFLGNNFVSYEKAVEIVREKKFKGMKYYKSWRERTQYKIPSAPKEVYTEFISWNKYLGHAIIPNYKKVFISYEEASKTVRMANIKSSEEYRKWKQKPFNIPSSPVKTYKNKGWQGWDDFLGRVRHKKFLSYNEAREIVIKSGIRSLREYKSWKERPFNIPCKPEETYKNKGWQGFLHFLGKI